MNIVTTVYYSHKDTSIGIKIVLKRGKGDQQAIAERDLTIKPQSIQLSGALFDHLLHPSQETFLDRDPSPCS